MVLCGQHQWWVRKVCSNGHGGKNTTGAWYWKVPTRTLAFERQKCAPRHKSSKECLTVMYCGNAFGNHKLKLIVIGKAKKP
jgi:hypothetical protein